MATTTIHLVDACVVNAEVEDGDPSGRSPLLSYTVILVHDAADV